MDDRWRRIHFVVALVSGWAFIGVSIFRFFTDPSPGGGEAKLELLSARVGLAGVLLLLASFLNEYRERKE